MDEALLRSMALPMMLGVALGTALAVQVRGEGLTAGTEAFYFAAGQAEVEAALAKTLGAKLRSGESAYERPSDVRAGLPSIQTEPLTPGARCCPVPPITRLMSGIG